jgi:hypothetical protein
MSWVVGKRYTRREIQAPFQHSRRAVRPAFGRGGESIPTNFGLRASIHSAASGPPTLPFPGTRTPAQRSRGARRTAGLDQHPPRNTSSKIPSQCGAYLPGLPRSLLKQRVRPCAIHRQRTSRVRRSIVKGILRLETRAPPALTTHERHRPSDSQSENTGPHESRGGAWDRQDSPGGFRTASMPSS